MSPRRPRLYGPLAGLALLLATLGPLTASCGRQDAGERARLSVWAHAGQPGEREALARVLSAFNARQDTLELELTFLPEGGYNAQVQAAALAGQLPDVLEFDGPFLQTYAAAGHLQPIGPLLPDSLRADLLPTLIRQGSYGDSLYAVGQFDSGLGLYGRRSLLETAGARLPAGPADAWTVEEFDALLGRLALGDADGAVLDLHLDYRGEWYTYAFLPWLWSAGGGLLGPGPQARAVGTLDSAASVDVLTRLQRWLQDGRVDPDVDGAAFTGGRVALSLGGHWNYPAYRDAWGDDLVLLPLPDWGRGSVSGQGSWQWGVRRGVPAGPAAACLRALLAPEAIDALCAANGAVPGRRSALTRSALYAEGGPLRLFADQLLGGFTRPRPRSAAYPLLTSSFQALIEDLRGGAAPAPLLAAAARRIDAELDARDAAR